MSGSKTSKNTPGIEKNCDEFQMMELSYAILEDPELRRELRHHVLAKLVRRVLKMSEDKDVREAMGIDDIEVARCKLVRRVLSVAEEQYVREVMGIDDPGTASLNTPMECDNHRFLDTLSKAREFISEYLRRNGR